MAPRKKNSSPPTPNISDAEWTVMRVLWARGSLRTNEVVEALGDCGWKPKTIHTLLTRLVRKGALQREKQGREYLFHTTVEASTCEHAVAQSFLSRFFGGDLVPFLTRFVEREKLTRSEISELKRILDRLD
jgi:BlaI family penicillinase repressor